MTPQDPRLELVVEPLADGRVRVSIPALELGGSLPAEAAARLGDSLQPGRHELCFGFDPLADDCEGWRRARGFRVVPEGYRRLQDWRDCLFQAASSPPEIWTQASFSTPSFSGDRLHCFTVRVLLGPRLLDLHESIEES